MNQARAFKELMRLRWGEHSIYGTSPAQVAEFWNLPEHKVKYLSRNALRVADVLDLPRILARGEVVISFDDGSLARTTVLGDRFLD